jgi:DNA-binding Lrp family transcriptional regulator
MGRPQSYIDPEILTDLILKGHTQSEMAGELGVSVPTLTKRIGRLQAEQGTILQYRALQSLQLTSLQARILEAITPEKIDEASLKDLVISYKILKEKELVIEGKPSEIKGILGYLVQLEKQEFASKQTVTTEVIDAMFTPTNGNTDWSTEIPDFSEDFDE